MPTSTKFTHRILAALEGASTEGATGRELAKQLWPDSPAWDRRTRGRSGNRNGALGGTLPMKGAKAGHDMVNLGYARVLYTEYSQPLFSITDTGRAVLARTENVPA
ncbi:hypothetical protein [Leifsonia sp. Leaf264]|uniref:hypothetical protein n=1 Tax=Leifsonia sp. Leaf264 TaxID=1736314 RepID=UPI0007023C13|nr:hypothetical protein [Leifsonia sp. Leaf264]KQO98614.1 hypothetical protein ASF30_11165 [Leifsonia sp. Leaf264]